MATPRKLNVFLAFPSYGGNGGISSEVPAIREWAVQTILKMKQDERVGEIESFTKADTPITMVRNDFAYRAKQGGYDVLVMIDSDMGPNFMAHEPWFKPFWDTSFDFLYDHWEKGPVCIGAPYCGAPAGGENIFVFRWRNNRNAEEQLSLDQYTREEAYYMGGIQEAAALPTGLIMYDLRCFDLIDTPWFTYEWKSEADGVCYYNEKASTEDVQNTRDISLAGITKLGYNPVFCNWDSWAAHYKPWPVCKPVIASAYDFASNIRKAVMADRRSDEKDIVLPQSDRLKHLPVNHVAPSEGEPETGPLHRNIKFFDGHSLLLNVTEHQTPDAHLDFLYQLAQHLGRRYTWFNILEIGSWSGESAACLLEGAIYSKSLRQHITCLDPYNGVEEPVKGASERAKALLKKNLDSIARNPNATWVHMEKASSDTTAEDLMLAADNSRYQLAFIDGDHSYEGVCTDINLALSLNVDVLVGHDYLANINEKSTGVTKAVFDNFGDRGLEIVRTSAGSMWIYDRAGVLDSSDGKELLEQHLPKETAV